MLNTEAQRRRGCLTQRRRDTEELKLKTQRSRGVMAWNKGRKRDRRDKSKGRKRDKSKGRRMQSICL